MTLTEQIAKIANTSLENARMIRNYIDDENLLDWSECTNREMAIAIKEAASELGVNS